MKLSADRLAGHLAQGLAPCYLVAGDEPLLVAEVLDAIRASARSRGYDEREQLVADRSAAVWEQAIASVQSGSLFASRRILELRLAGKPGHGAASLERLAAAAGDDLLLIVIAPRLDREALGAAWVRALAERGALIEVLPPPAAQFPQWLRTRLATAGVRLTDPALELLAAATEGNLLAAQQEIDKLALAGPGDEMLDEARLAATLADSARFEIQSLTQAVAAGDAARALRVLAGLRAEGDEPVRVLWWLLRAMHGFPGAPKSLPMPRVVARAALVDRIAKGQAPGSAWDALALLAAELCGRRTLPLPRAAARREMQRA
jgi:DNA polymerase-3 subunit delta